MCAVPVSPRDWSWDNRCSLVAASDSAGANVGKRVLAGRGLSTHLSPAQELAPQVPPPAPEGSRATGRACEPAALVSLQLLETR